ncbi:MAG: hypothetical protein ABIP35_08630 [Ginsengibacter sp.]
MFKSLVTFLIFLAFQNTSFAQDTLPKITVNQLGKKVLVSWVNPYTSVTNINIQRSGDSLKNFTTIGSVLNVNTQSNGFVDAKEFIPNVQYYRLFISFEGGSFIFTEAKRPALDTLQAIVDESIYSQPVNTWFVPSRHIFTGRDNNIIITLKDAAKHKYSLKFFEDDGTFLFEINRINENYLTLDKVNFLHSGLFRFELYDNKVIVERHKIYIPKDGKPSPSLDSNGYEVKPK